ncbi:MAG: ABC-2 type transport system permease protein [Bradymonadia bacterium]|jgi:ABC-2 type transport system permease protein
MIGVIARKELRELVRDGRLRLLGGIVVILALAAFAFGAQQTLRAQEAREHAQERAAAQWEGQGEKNPHVAAHYGTYAFAPTNVTTALDPGVSAFLGRSVKLEAHRRNLASQSAAQDGGTQRLGEFSVATVLLMLVPLLIIALGYGVWSQERERGTLRQLLSTGVDRRALLAGKALALFIVLTGLLLPAGVLIVGGLWALGGGGLATLGRVGLLVLGYGAYFAVFAGLTLYASAVARSSRGALVGAIAMWALFCLLVPRVGSELAATIEPLPSQAELARAVESSLAKGIDGTTEREVAIEAMVADAMDAQGIANAGFLVDQGATTAIELQAEARWEDAAYDHHVGQLEDRIATQEGWAAGVGIISPFVAMRGLSAGLCGTDYAHHRHFTDYTEAWRKRLVAQLNTAFGENAGADGWAYRAGPDLWKNAPPFEYTAPGLGFVWRHHAFDMLVLLGWLALALGLARRSARRVRVV